MASPPMICGLLHGDECEQPLDPTWAFCARCGRPTWSLAPAASSVLAASSPPRFELPFRFRRGGTEGAATLELEVLPSTWEDGSPVTWAFAVNGAPSRSWSAPFDAAHQPAAHGLVRLGSGSDGRSFRARARVRLFDAPASEDGFSLPIEPARHERETLWEWDVRLPRPGHLKLDAQLLFFGDHTHERELRARNEGDEPLDFGPLHLPRGFELLDGAGKNGEAFRLLPGAGCVWRVRRAGAVAGRACWAFQSPNGTSLGEVSLLAGDPASAQSSARWIVGVDFGTSGTSVWKRPALDEGAPPQVLRDAYALEAAGEDPRRFPTLIYLRFEAGLERGLFIGFRALREWERDGYNPERGLLVRELKSLLRSSDEPFISIHPRFTVDNLLRRFLEELKRTLIEPETGGAGTAIAWNFSLPVLDSHQGGSGQLFARQKERFERGLRAAGYASANCSLAFWTEPFCAAASLLTRRGDWKFPANRPPQKGDWMLVFDSGGGTTDAVLGRLDFDDAGHLLLEEVATLGGFERDGSAANSKLITFGGEALSRRTAVFLTAVFPDRNALLDWPGLDAARIDLLTLVARQGDEALARQFAFDPKAPKTAEPSLPNPWMVDPTILRAFEAPKRALAALPTRLASHDVRRELPHIRAALPGVSDRFSIRRAEFDQVVVDENCLDPLWREFAFQILGERDGKRVRADRPTRDEVAWVFPVGGNCRVKRIVERLESEFGLAVQDLSIERVDSTGKITRDDSERLLAVSAGTIWAQSARPAHVAPFDVRIKREDASETLFEIPARAPLGEEFSFPKRTFSVPRGQGLGFEVVAAGEWRAGGQTLEFKGLIGRFGVRSDAGAEDARPFTFDLQLSATSRGVEVRLRRDEGAPAQKVWEFRW